MVRGAGGIKAGLMEHGSTSLPGDGVGPQSMPPLLRQTHPFLIQPFFSRFIRFLGAASFVLQGDGISFLLLPDDYQA